MDKNTLRRQILTLRDRLTQQERECAEWLITERICGHQWFYLSDCILGFASYGSEIATGEILQEAILRGKSVYLPKVELSDTGENTMQFYRVEDLHTLTPGYKGILEPAGDTEPFCYRSEMADRVLMLMPGVVFDRQRHRIGYGKGFYDRYLAEKADLQLRTIALGYQCQLVEELPQETWDICPYQVICV